MLNYCKITFFFFSIPTKSGLYCMNDIRKQKKLLNACRSLVFYLLLQSI